MWVGLTYSIFGRQLRAAIVGELREDGRGQALNSQVWVCWICMFFWLCRFFVGVLGVLGSFVYFEGSVGWTGGWVALKAVSERQV